MVHVEVLDVSFLQRKKTRGDAHQQPQQEKYPGALDLAPFCCRALEAGEAGASLHIANGGLPARSTAQHTDSTHGEAENGLLSSSWTGDSRI